MADGFIIKNAERTERRRFNKVFHNDLRRYVSEIVINSDDSYKRLVQAGKLDGDQIVPIYITINKTKKEIVIVDNAEGMNLKDMERNFSEYGADTGGGSQGFKVRSLFGQGATDVFLNIAQRGKNAEVCSFKDDVYYTCKFKWDEGGEKRGIPQQPKISRAQMRQIRSHYKVPVNGTIVRFQLHDDIRIPNDVTEEIRTFYLLRFILANSKRNVVLRVISASKAGQDIRLQYAFPDINQEEKLLDSEVSFKYESKDITGRLTIFRKNETSPEDYGELKILCYDDEQNVYDNTLFGYEKAPGAELLHGYLELEGTYDLIRQKLNQKNPEEILTETRDGFDKGHDFYKSLVGAIETSIRDILKKLGDVSRSKTVSLENQKDWNEAFKEINKYFKEELEEEVGGVTPGQDPPAEGMRFIFPNIKITTGKRYSLKLLINTDKIPFGTKIETTISKNDIEYSPHDFELNEGDTIEGSLAAKSFSFQGNVATESSVVLIAKAKGGQSAKLFIDVIDKEIHYPKYGLEFWPNSIFAKVNNPTKAHLFFDTNKHPIGSIVRFTSNSPNVLLNERAIKLTNSNLISDTIGAVECVFSCAVKDLAATITGLCNNSSATVKVVFKEHSQPPAGSGGFLAGVEIKPSSQFWQTYYDRPTGKINVNNQNNINQLHLGEVSAINADKLTREQRKYLSELCSQESARQLVRLKIEKGKIAGDDYEEVLDAIQIEKNKLLGIFLKNIDKIT